jgi:hypothetical protein
MPQVSPSWSRLLYGRSSSNFIVRPSVVAVSRVMYRLAYLLRDEYTWLLAHWARRPGNRSETERWIDDTHRLRGVCFKIEVVRNSLNLYWQQLQDRLMDVVRPLVGGRLRFVWHWHRYLVGRPGHFKRAYITGTGYDNHLFAG